jgi:hypothetical protein
MASALTSSDILPANQSTAVYAVVQKHSHFLNSAGANALAVERLLH